MGIPDSHWEVEPCFSLWREMQPHQGGSGACPWCALQALGTSSLWLSLQWLEPHLLMHNVHIFLFQCSVPAPQRANT